MKRTGRNCPVMKTIWQDITNVLKLWNPPPPKYFCNLNSAITFCVSKCWFKEIVHYFDWKDLNHSHCITVHCHYPKCLHLWSDPEVYFILLVAAFQLICCLCDFWRKVRDEDGTWPARPNITWIELSYTFPHPWTFLPESLCLKLGAASFEGWSLRRHGPPRHEGPLIVKWEGLVVGEFFLYRCVTKQRSCI